MLLDSAKLPLSWAAAAAAAADWRMLSTHPLIGHADDPGVAAYHQEDEAEQRHVPSAKHKHKQVVRKLQMSKVIKISLLFFVCL